MDTFIAYFDLLGYKSFIMNNKPAYLSKRINQVFVHVETALSQRSFKNVEEGVIADLSKSQISCQIISDTIILWIDEISQDAFNELVFATQEINWNLNRFGFPVRGAMVFGDYSMKSASLENKVGGKYTVNSIFGHGLAIGHIKCEDLNLAGCVIDKSVIEAVNEMGISNAIIIENAMLYRVPYKSGNLDADEYLYSFCNRPTNKKFIANIEADISRMFHADNKKITDRASKILSNTLTFLHTH